VLPLSTSVPGSVLLRKLPIESPYSHGGSGDGVDRLGRDDIRQRVIITVQTVDRKTIDDEYTQQHSDGIHFRFSYNI